MSLRTAFNRPRFHPIGTFPDAVSGDRNQQRVDQIMQLQGGGNGAGAMDPMLRMMLESGMPGAVNGYGGVNPYMLG